MNVLLICLATYSRLGGLQNFNRRLIANLAALVSNGALEACAVCLMDDEAKDLPANQAIEIAGFGRRRLSFVRDILSKLANVDELLVGHVNLLSIAWLAKRVRPSMRVTLFVHGDDVWNDELRPRRFLEPFLLRSIDRIASVSKYTAAVMSREFRVPAEKFVIYPNAIDDFPPPERLPQAGREVICVTRMGPGDRRKNVDQLVLAMAVLKNRGCPASLNVVGDGALRAELESLALNLGLSDRVHFSGRLSDEDLKVAYQRSDIFVLPSSKEGFGIVYLEAWSHGLPVICGSRGAPHEIVSHGSDGLVVDELSPEALADGIEMLLSDPIKSRHMGQAGCEKARSLYLNTNALERLCALMSARQDVALP